MKCKMKCKKWRLSPALLQVSVSPGRCVQSGRLMAMGDTVWETPSQRGQNATKKKKKKSPLDEHALQAFRVVPHGRSLYVQAVVNDASPELTWRLHVHFPQRRFRCLRWCLADCKTQCPSLCRQKTLSNHVIHHIFRSVGFKIKC